MGLSLNSSSGLDVFYGDAAAGYVFPGYTGLLTSGNMLRSTRSSAGVWSGPTTILAMTSQGLDNPAAIVNSTAKARIMFTEVTSDWTTVSGILRGYVYDETDFVARSLHQEVSTKLDPANTAAGIALSNGNLTARATGTNLLGQVSRTIASASANSYYAEFSIDFKPAANLGVGLINATQALTGKFLGDTGNNSVGYYSSSGVYRNGSAVGNATAFAQGATLSMAWNETSKKVWFRSNCGNWNNDVIGNQNPATGTGGFDISAITGAVFPAIDLEDTGDQITINPGNTGQFNCTVPAGYSILGQ
jgi:hypothetical protein